MKISLAIISTLLILSVFIPFILFIYNGKKNTDSIKKQSNALIKNNGIIYSLKEVWHKNFIGISNDNKTITYIHVKQNNPFMIDVDLKDIKQCNIIKNHNNGEAKGVSLKNLDLEFVYKLASKPNIRINFFNIDDDLSEDFEMQRIEKWHTLIKQAILDPETVKMAS